MFGRVGSGGEVHPRLGEMHMTMDSFCGYVLNSFVIFPGHEIKVPRGQTAFFYLIQNTDGQKFP